MDGYNISAQLEEQSARVEQLVNLIIKIILFVMVQTITRGIV